MTLTIEMLFVWTLFLIKLVTERRSYFISKRYDIVTKILFFSKI